MNLTLGLTSNKLFIRGFQAAYREVSMVKLGVEDKHDSVYDLVAAASEIDNEEFLHRIQLRMKARISYLRETLNQNKNEVCFGLASLYLEEFPSDFQISGDDWKPFFKGFETALDLLECSRGIYD